MKQLQVKSSEVVRRLLWPTLIQFGFWIGTVHRNYAAAFSLPRFEFAPETMRVEAE